MISTNRWWITAAAIAAISTAAHGQGTGADDPVGPPREAAGSAQPSEASGTPEQPGAGEKSDSNKPPQMPSLDQLLGLTGEPDESKAGDQSDKDLERALSGAEIGDAFTQAVGLMRDVADRIQDHRDTGLATQRLQEDIVKRLDQLIRSIQQQQQSSSSSSSSRQRSSQSQPNQPSPAVQPQPSGESSEHANAPPRQDGPLRPNLDAATSAWGNLPARVRDMLLQGAGDKFSAMYERMTESYYKRLAEEATPR